MLKKPATCFCPEPIIPVYVVHFIYLNFILTRFAHLRLAVGYPGFFFGGVQQIQLRTEDRDDGDLGAVAPLVGGSGGSCNLVQEISFHIVKFS